MHARSWLRGLILGALLGLGSDPAAVGAQTVEELKERIQDLERSTREQVEALKRLIEKQEVDREGQRRAEEERDRAYQVLKEQVERQTPSLTSPCERRRSAGRHRPVRRAVS
jgi:flagellar biosynthesis GTPase FlhF